MPLTLGFVGRKGSGKGSVLDLFTTFAGELSLSVAKIGFSKRLREIAELAGQEPSVANLQGIGQDLENRFGSGTVASMAKLESEKVIADIKGFDGVRWWTDYEMIRSCTPNVLIYTIADDRIRWIRSRIRKQRPGDETKSFEQFMIEEQAENEKYIPQIGEKADFVIENNMGVELTDVQAATELERKARVVFDEIARTYL